MKKLCLLTLIFISWLAQAQPSLSWQKLSTAPMTPRVDFGFFTIDSDFYMIGGIDSALHSYHDVWRYHIPSNQWMQMDTFPGGDIAETTGFSINKKGYICTGIYIDSFQSPLCGSLFWEYDPSIDKWTRKADFPGDTREQADAIAYGGNGYLGLGYNCSVMLRDLWRYSPDSDSWYKLDSFPAIGRTNSNIVALNNSLYFIGGLFITIQLQQKSGDMILHSIGG